MADPMVRLLFCGKCKTAEVLDDYNGPPEMADRFDVVLQIAVQGHQDGVERIPHAPAALVKMTKAEYDNPKIREATIKQVQESFDPNAETGLGSVAYAMRDNFRADALDCFSKHNRNPACGDYRAPHKRLVPDTNAERRDAGMAAAKDYDKNDPNLTKFLCDYCPVQSMVMQAARKKAGAYDH